MVEVGQYNKIMRRDYLFGILSVLGIWASLVVIFAVWEFKGLEGGVAAFQQIPKSVFVFQTGAGPYIVSIISWTALLLLLGYVWSKILFPKRHWVEKVIFSLCFGVVIMPISFRIPFFLGAVGKVFANILGLASPAYADAFFGGFLYMLVNNLEQAYELVNVLIFFVIGLIILMIKRSKSGKLAAVSSEQNL